MDPRHQPRRPLLRVTAVLAVVALLLLPGEALAARSAVIKVFGQDIFCPIDTPEAGGYLFAITRDRSDGAGFAFADLYIEPSDPDAPVIGGGMDDPDLSSSGINATFDVHDVDTDDVIGSATVSATFVGTGAYRVRRVSQDSVQKGLFEQYVVTGTIQVTTTGRDYTFDMSGCDASGQDRLDQIHSPSGPKPGDTRPANDGPTGAVAVLVGSKLQQWTGGAAFDSEAPCLMGDPGDQFEFGLGRTVWFSVQGTGSPITFDPKGSDFDTVIAAYASTEGGLQQVGCVDDDAAPHTTQGPLTFDTQAGTTYLVQIGGVLGLLGSDTTDPQWGRLRLKVE
jgi:hypothetical protein